MPDPRPLALQRSAATPSAPMHVPARASSLAGRVPPTVLVLLSMLSTEVGAALARHLFGVTGPGGTVLLRVGFAAGILVATQGGLPLRAPRAAYVPAVLFGLALAGMNFAFYSSMARIPLGIAVSIEFVGPLAVAVAGSRRALDFFWALLAAAGILLFAPWTGARLDPLGVLFALAAGCGWASYIVLSARVGRLFPGRSGLTLAMCVAAVVLLPVGVVSAGTRLLDPVVLVGGCVVALLSSALPYALDIEALRRLPTRVFSILMSAAPAIAALVGFVLLGQRLSPRDLLAVALVMGASLGVTWHRQRATVAH